MGIRVLGLGRFSGDGVLVIGGFGNGVCGIGDLWRGVCLGEYLCLGEEFERLEVGGLFLYLVSECVDTFVWMYGWWLLVCGGCEWWGLACLCVGFLRVYFVCFFVVGCFV